MILQKSSVLLAGLALALGAWSTTMAQETCENCQNSGPSAYAPHAGTRVLRAAAVPFAPASATGDCSYAQYGPHDLFRQYYAPNNCGGPVAELYPAPHPVPPHVGGVFYTYQPLYPHEFMYAHHRTYHRYYDNGRGLTRTSVHWTR